MPLLQPRKIRGSMDDGYYTPNDTTDAFATTVYRDIVSGLPFTFREEIRDGVLLTRTKFGVSADTSLEFWMTTSDRREQFPLFGDVCFHQPKSAMDGHAYPYTFSKGERFAEMLRLKEPPFYRIAHFTDTPLVITSEASDTVPLVIPQPQSMVRLHQKLKARGVMQ